jgi:cobalt/nickel transport system permease protein
MHRASPLSKLIGAALAFGVTALTNSAPALMVEFLLVLVFLALARLPILRMLQWALYPVFFASLFALSQLPYSFVLPIVTLIKATNSALIVLLLVGTTPYPELFSIIGAFSQTLGNISFLTYRFFFLLVDQVDRRLSAMETRGGLAGDWGRKIANLAGFAASIFVISFETSENVFAAMGIRGYSGRILCHRKLERGLNKSDLVPFAFAFCFLATSVAFLFLKEWGVFT